MTFKFTRARPPRRWRHHQETVHKLTLHLFGRFSAFTEEMNRASLAASQTASNLLYLALNYYRATADNGHGEVHGKRLNRIRTAPVSLMHPDFTRTREKCPLNATRHVFWRLCSKYDSEISLSMARHKRFNSESVMEHSEI